MAAVDDWLARAGFALIGPTCVLCAAPGAPDRDLCLACDRALPRNTCACPLCALPLAVAAPACANCLRRAPPMVATRAALRYEGDARRLLPRYKFGANLAAGRVLAGLLVEAVARAPRPDLVLPVPLHTQRLRERGFDQAWELARAVAHELRLPARCDALCRTRATPAQTGLDAAARRRNLRDAFGADPAVRGLHLAVVDDVMTTGATVAAAARALQRAGAASVQAWVVARAPR